MSPNNYSNSNNGKSNKLAAQELIEQLVLDLETLSKNILQAVSLEELPSSEQLEERDRMIGILESILDKNLATISLEKIQSLIQLNDEIMTSLNGSKENTKDEISSTFKQKEKIKKYNLKEVR